MIEKLKPESPVFLYYFFKDGSRETTSGRVMVASLINQIVLRDPTDSSEAGRYHEMPIRFAFVETIP